MTIAESTIDAGVCGFVTTVTATADDDALVTFRIETPCENLRRFAEALPAVDAYSEIAKGFEGQVHQAAMTTLKGCCSGCIAPNGVFKAMQIAAGLALPRDAGLALRRLETQA